MLLSDQLTIFGGAGSPLQMRVEGSGQRIGHWKVKLDLVVESLRGLT